MNEVNEKMIIENELLSEKKRRSKDYDYVSISANKLNEYQENGWEIDKEFKKSIRMKQIRSIEERFTNRIWVMLYNLGFTTMNKEPIRFNANNINIVASDNETLLVIICETTEEKLKRQSFKDLIEKNFTNKEKYIQMSRKLFPNEKRKIAYLFFTENFILPDQDHKLMSDHRVTYLDEESILYYETLAKHLGQAARYQLLGYLFAGQRIPEIDNKIPAIEGQMGGHRYYSFSIEPEKLLKIGYILHRNEANKQLMPTYQRLIKKPRLNSVKAFIDKGGFFPNSIVINIDSDGKKLNFDLSEKQILNSVSKIGILHLPQVYRAAYIIDGQHRLYGYSDTKYERTNSIPVVAFVNLDRKEQVKLFMDINENQKSVSKNLRNTLNSDLLWDSDDFNERVKALKLLIAQELGEDRDSSLYNRIIVGENSKTAYTNITIDTIKIALDHCDFLSQYKKNELIKEGTMDTGRNEETHYLLLSFLKKSFYYLEKNMQLQWINDESDPKSYLITNAGVYSLIRILNDIVNQITSEGSGDFRNVSDETMDQVYVYLDLLVNHYRSITDEKKIELRKSYGTAGRTKYWRTLQKGMNALDSNFEPDGLETYWRDNDKRFNDESFGMIRDIEQFLNYDFQQKLEKHFGVNWFKKGLPRKVYDSSIQLAAAKNYEKNEDEEEVTPWGNLNVINYRDIATHGKNWSEIFEKNYTMPGEEKISGGKQAKTKWIEKFSRIRNENAHTYSVSQEEFEFLEKLHKWLIASD